MKTSHALWSILAVATLAGCGLMSEAGPGTKPVTESPDVTEANAFLERAAKRQREKFKNMTFEQFKSKVYREPAELGGKYIVNGDTPVLNEKRLEEFFEKQVLEEPAPMPTHLLADQLADEIVVHQVGGQDAVWNSAMQRQLTYCVSDTFGARHAQVVADMEAAADAWEEVADIDFIHVDAEDGNCNASNSNVVFDVRPVNVDGEYLARAFFPNEPRSARNVLIDESSFQLDPNGTLQLVGILRHELGHTLGFRHEHTRPESGACFEDDDWRPLTDYDPFSVMHYPQCNGQGDWSLTLTHRDRNGAACVYGPAEGFTVDPGLDLERCRAPGPEPCTVQTQVFAQQTVARGQENQYGPFPVASGTVFEAKMEGTGDPDLYVRFGQRPTRSQYACRPYTSGADETCSLDVPDEQSEAFVMVRGYTDGSYTLTIVHTSP